jgi:hypothetical protein
MNHLLSGPKAGEFISVGKTEQYHNTHEKNDDN